MNWCVRENGKLQRFDMKKIKNLEGKHLQSQTSCLALHEEEDG